MLSFEFFDEIIKSFKCERIVHMRVFGSLNNICFVPKVRIYCDGCTLKKSGKDVSTKPEI